MVEECVVVVEDIVVDVEERGRRLLSCVSSNGVITPLEDKSLIEIFCFLNGR